MITDAERTIGSLRKINDFPFYTAEYSGNYRIDEFSRGAVADPADVVPFFQSLFSELGKPADLSFPEPPGFETGCSAFFCRNSSGAVILGKNLDWKQEPVLLLRTEPGTGYSSLSMVNLSFCDIFRLGSFEHSLLLSPYVPLDGINEEGLAVSMLSVQQAAGYPLSPGNLSVGDFNIIRIILDTCRSVDEAISVFKRYNLMQTGVLPLHYIIVDRDESCIVEFFDNGMHLLRDGRVNYLTNFLRLKDSEYTREKEQCERYQLLETEFTDENRRIDSNDAKKLLKDLSVYTEGFEIPSTIWSILYDLEQPALNVRVGNDTEYRPFQVGNS